MVTVFENVRERSAAKKFCPVTLLSLVRKIFEKLLNNRLLEKCGRFDFQYDLYLIEFVSVVSNRIGRALNRFGATRAVRRLRLRQTVRYIQSFEQGLACWSSSQTQGLFNFR